MSYHVFFDMSTGLRHSLFAPPGTLQSIWTHAEVIEAALQLQRAQYHDNPVHWNPWQRNFQQFSAEYLCRHVHEHNQWVMRMWELFEKWDTCPVDGGEEITPEESQRFWFVFERFSVPVEKWTKEYYEERMQVLYEVMRGRETEGITFGTQKLTPRQAAAVIRLFAEFLDADDIRLDVPWGEDYLTSSYYGGYEWCDSCYKPMNDNGRARCRRKRCPLNEEQED